MALWDDFVNNIRRSVDQINPWDGGRNWNTLDAEKKKKEEEERRRQQQAAATPRVQQTTTIPAPNFNANTTANPVLQQPNFSLNQKPQTPFVDPTVPKNTSIPQRTFGANSGAQSNLSTDMLKTPQQKQFEATIAARNARLNKDGTVNDIRPFPTRVPNDQFSQANEALKQGATIQDVGNYWKSDADALRAELMKPNPDKARVQGLTQSINNRKGEIQQMSTQMSRDEQEAFADKRMKERGGKFDNGRNEAAEFVGDVLMAAPRAVAKIPTTIFAENNNVKQPIQQRLTQLNDDYLAGRITKGRLQEEFNAATDGIIDRYGAKVTDKGIERKGVLGSTFGVLGEGMQAGLDVYVGGGTGVKATLVTTKEAAQVGAKELLKASIKQGLKESAVTGTLQTGADALQGRDITPETLLMNYGVDAVLNTGGEITGRAVKKMVTDKQVKEATQNLNKALRKNGSLDLMSETEVRGAMEKEATDQINNATKEVNDKKAAQKPQQTPPDALVPQVEQTPNSLEQNVTEPPTKPRSTQSIADLLPGLIGRDPNATVKQFDPADFGVEKSTYDRLSRQYGEQAAQNILNSSKDATNIRSMDAFVTSEAKKRYGAPKSNQQVQAEINARQAKAEEFNMTQGAPVPDEVVAVNGQMVNTRSTFYNSLDVPKKDLIIKNGEGTAMSIEPLEPLKQEALKYKSADEFVKAQGEPVYHRSQNKFDKFDISKVSNDSNRQRYGWGLYFSDTIPHDQYGKNLYEARLPKGTFIDSKQPVDEKIVSKIAEAVKGNNKNPSELVEFSYNGYLFYKTLSRILGGDKEASLFLSKNNIDGLKSNIGKNANDYILFNDKSIKTKAQLTDLYNQAHTPQPKPVAQGRVEAPKRPTPFEQDLQKAGLGAKPDEVVAVNGQMVNTRTGEIVEDAPQPLMQEGGLIQQNSSLAPETVDVAQRPDLIPENAQAITSDGQPIVDSPIQTATDTMPQLGTMSEQFYKSRENQNISYEDMVKLRDNVVSQITDTAQKNGIDFQSVVRRVQENEVNQVPYNEGLSDIETRLWDSTQTELNYMRARRGETAELSQNDRGQYYFPHQKADQTGSLTGGFTTGTPGNEMARKSVDDGGLGLDDIDYSPNVIGDYILRYADGKVLNEKRINQALDAAHPEVAPEIRSKAAKMIGSLQEDVNKLKKKISLGGAGKKAIISSDKPIDSAARLSEVGQTLGREQTIIAQEPKGLLNGDRINSVMVGDKPLGSVVGLNQYRDAATYAGTQVREADGDKDALIGLVTARLTNEYNIPTEDVDKAVNIIANMDNKMSDELKQARVTAIYTNAAKQQIIDTLQILDIKSPKLRKDISDLTNQYLRAGSIEGELSDKLVRNALRITNALFRKLNVSSAINEMSDLTSFASAYGKNLTLIPDYSVLKSYNIGDIDPAVEPYLKQLNEGTPLKKVLRSINDVTNLYRFVETYKAGVVINSAIKKHSGTLTGDALTKKVLQEYRDIALPRDEFTRTFLDDYPLWTQYMSWGVMNIGKEAKLARGKLEVGDLNDMSQKQRIARNLYANIPAKTAFWLATNGLKGTTIATAFGLTDFTGLTSQDYSGIAEEDKSLYDRTTQFTNQSTIMSLVNTVYQSWEKEQLKNSEKYKNADYNPYKDSNFADSAIATFTPQVIKNTVGTPGRDGAVQLMQKGYSENAGGRVQYEAPTDPYNQIKAYVFGKNQTANAREYSGRENVVDRVNDGKNPISAVTDMAQEQLGIKETDYKRPLTDKYSEAYKNADKDGRTAMLEGGRQFNKYLDDMKKNSPDDHNRYVGTMDGNHVSPEYWKGIAGDKNDLTVFKTMGDRKKQLKKDLGIDYDPLYDLPDDQARSVLQLKSAPTGDDIALRNMLGKEGWYKDYKAKVSAYYDAAGEKTDSEFKETQRVKDWNTLDDQLQSFYYDKTATEAPAWAAQYPLVYEAKKYEYGSPESKAFFKNNYDAYAAQKEAMEKSQLDVINAMRKIEGFPPMGWEQYQQATEFADTDSDSKKSGWKNYSKKGGGSGSGGGNNRAMGVKSASFGKSRAGGYSPVSSVKVKKAPRKARVRSGVKGGKIVVTSKKTL